MRFATLTLAAVSALTLAACDKPATSADSPRDPVPEAVMTPSWICGREYENHAWGYQRRGVVIDGQGHILKYEFKSTPTALVNPWKADDFGHMTPENLKLRYNGATDTGKTVSAQDIAKALPLIEEAARTQPTEGKHVGADMGSHILYCYKFDNVTGLYAQVLLDQKGDFESTNPSPAAKELATWLVSAFGTSDEPAPAQ